VFQSTTILAVRRNGKTALAGDGQVTVQEKVVVKTNARKVRRLYDGQVLAGFAGAAADALALFEKFEKKLEEAHGNLARAVVELAKDWRTDRMLRRLEALMLVADSERLFLVSGSGEVLEAEEGVMAIGSGQAYALSAARALLKFTDLEAPELAREAMSLTADICVYTNDAIVVETLSG
jgi:ATP-dependent HslUV protease subunit HslV